MTSDNTTEEKQSGKQDKIKIPLLLPLTLVILALLGAAIVSIYRLQQQHINNQTQMRIDKTQHMFQMELDEDAELLNGLIDFLEHDENIQNAWLVKDRDALLQCTLPVFKEICSKYRVTHFYFIDMDRLCFLRVHNPPRHGDYIDRFTMDHAVRQKKPTYGIELGPYGTFTLRVVCPWKISGELAGYIELGQEIEHIIPELRKVTGSEIFFVIEKSYLNRAKWEEGMRMIGHDRNWDRFEQFVVISSTKEEIPPTLNEIMERYHVKHGKFFFDLSIGGRHFHNGFVPLFDAGGREVGKIVVMNDVTEKEASLRTSAAVLTTICAVIGGLLFTFFYFFIGRIERRIIKGRNDLIDGINERKKAEEEIRQQNEFLGNILESLTYPFYVIDANDYTIKIANSAANLGDLSEKTTCYALTHKRDKPCTDEQICPLQEVKKTKKPVVVEHIHYDKDGNARNVEVRGYPIFDKEGNVVQMIEYSLDITERRKAKKEIESLAKFPSENPNPVLRIADNGTVLYSNMASSPLLEDWGCEINKCVPDRWRQLVADTLESGLRKNIEIEHRGRTFLFEVVPVVDANYVNLYGSDITERKKARETLKKALDEWESTFNAAEDSITLIDSEFKIVQANLATSRFLGKPLNEILGKMCHQLFHATDSSPEVCPLRRCKKTGKHEQVDLHVPEKDMWISASIDPIFDDQGNIRNAVHIIRDITERKKAEQALRESEEKYKTLTESSLTGVFIHQDGRYVFVNKRFAQIHDYRPEELLGKEYLSLIHPDERDTVAQIVSKRLAGEPITQRYEMRRLKKNGQTIWCEVMITCVDYKARPAIMGNIIDTTVRRKAEELLEKLNKDLESTIQELTRSNQQLQEFTYVAAHDLKTPLRAIGTLADWISTDYGDKLDEKGREQINLLVEKTKRMDNLIDSILHYSKVGHTIQKDQTVDLNKLLSKAISEIGPLENIEITIDSELPTIICEKTRMMQVFENLLSNAVKYIDKPKGRIRVGCVAEDGFFKFSVADNGPGIEERYFEKIFGIFQTLSSRDEVASTGIGLSIVKRIVNVYDGSVWVESEVGKGSTFFFTLPKQMEAKNAKLESNIAC